MIPRDATRTNPYAFAWNDPMNGSDPTGLDPPPEQTDPTRFIRPLYFTGLFSEWQQIRSNPNPSTPGPTPHGPSIPDRLALSLAGRLIGGQYAPKPLSGGELFGLWQQTQSLGGENVEDDLRGVRDAIREGRWGAALWHAKLYFDDAGVIVASGGYRPTAVQPPATRGIGRGGQGITFRELEGGTGDAFSGHGTINPFGPTTTVPPGTTLTVWGNPGLELDVADGVLIEAGKFDELPLMEGARSYLPGAEIPDLILHPPDGIFVMKNSITVTRPTQVWQLLRPNMGHMQWSACLICK